LLRLVSGAFAGFNVDDVFAAIVGKTANPVLNQITIPQAEVRMSVAEHVLARKTSSRATPSLRPDRDHETEIVRPFRSSV
jgi:hypothetical protein